MGVWRLGVGYIRRKVRFLIGTYKNLLCVYYASYAIVDIIL